MQLITIIASAPLVALATANASLPPIPADKSTPVHQRVAIDGSNSMAVSWSTYQNQTESCVEFGKSPYNLDKKVCSSKSTTYPTSRTWFHTVSLEGLDAGKTYYYKIVGGNSTVDHFMTARIAGDRTPFAINAIIDLGVYGEDGFTVAGDGEKNKRDTPPVIQPSLNHTTIGRLASTVDDYEFIIHPGDLAYADAWMLRAKNKCDAKNAFTAILEQFYAQLAPIAGRKPYMVSPGNHEAACQEVPHSTGMCATGQKNFTDFMTRFEGSMPSAFVSLSNNQQAKVSANKAKELARPPFWYSFEYGMAHIVMFNTETDFSDAPDAPDGFAGLDSGPFGALNQQLQFLEADLASVDRSVTPWLIVAGHRPWYTLGGVCKPCQTAFEDIFYNYGVDLAVFGHAHNSQRFLPTFRNTKDPNGYRNPKAPMYIVAGGSGNIEGIEKLPYSKAPDYFAWGYDEDWSYATLWLKDENNLQVDFYSSSTGKLLDSTNLCKEHSEQFVRQLDGQAMLVQLPNSAKVTQS